MSYPVGFRSKVIGIIFLAILIKLLLDYKYGPPERLHPFAASAINRAPTEECKQQIREVVLRIGHAQRSSLTRTCPLDLIGPSRYKLGCWKEPWKGANRINESIEDGQDCLDKCFAYGHSFAGYVPSASKCYCNSKSPITKRGNCQDRSHVNIFRTNHGIFSSNINASNVDHLHTKIQKHVRIAFVLILSGRSSQQILRLLEAIYSEKHLYYLHIDEKDEFLYKDLLIAFTKMRRNNVLFARHRYATIWGGPQLLDMMLEAIRQLNRLYGWDYLINLSETDFPVKPIDELVDYIGRYESSSPLFLKYHSLKGYNFISKQGLNMHFVQCERRAWLVGPKKLPSGIVYSGGSDWLALPRDFCTYIEDSLEGKIDGDLAVGLVDTYKTALLPAESFFHTLAMNSHFCNRIVKSNLRFANWKGRRGCNCQQQKSVDWCGCGPMIYKKSDWKTLNSSKLLDYLFFSRKFDSRLSMSILNLIEDNLVSNRNYSSNDTRYWQNLYTRELDPKSETFEEFGRMSSSRVPSLTGLDASTHLQSIYAFYNHDRFAGWITVHCSAELCTQLLTSNSWNRAQANKTCNKIVELKSYQLGHGFDEREQVFRDERPFNSNSTVALLFELQFIKPNSSTTVEIIWQNDMANVTVHQNIMAKHPLKSNSSVHIKPLNAVGWPIKAGIWKLRIIRDSEECLQTSFLVLGSSIVNVGGGREMMRTFDFHYPLEGRFTSNKTSDGTDGPGWVVRWH